MGEVPEESLEGWAPEVGPDLPLARLVDLAFDYRGNVTLVMRDGTLRAGYVFNRDDRGPDPALQMFDEAGNGPIVVSYAQLRTIHFTGRDTAAGTSWKAWLERREAAKRGEAGDTPDADPDRG